MRNTKLIYPELSYRINGILYKIHNDLGRYCNEKQYSDCLGKELKMNGLNFEREKILPNYLFVGEQNNRNRLDFLVDEKIVIEIKCKRILERNDYYQLQRYLSASGYKLGLLVNFRERYLKPRRVLNSKSKY